jgi:hypothetical protein|tara:strand:- start:146 stop:400 length:255 start_codon:yes stop_codon:yes gene_type:complete
MKTIEPNDIKKGTVGYQKNGWKFEMMDNKKGNIRMAKVYGYATEIGSIYAHDIDYVIIDGQDVQVDASRYEVQANMVKAFDSMW